MNNAYSKGAGLTLLLTALNACAQGTPTSMSENISPENPVLSTNIPPQCTQVIEDHVRTTRGWNRSTYIIFNEVAVIGGRGFSIQHNDDKGISERSKSFHIELNESCTSVIKELAYQ